MSISSLSPNSILATPVQANTQIKSDLKSSNPQVAQDAQKVASSAQTDTITISRQALKMADEKSTAVKESAAKLEDKKTAQAASDNSNSAKTPAQKDALKAYSAVAASQ